MDKHGCAPNFIGITTPGVPDLSPETSLRVYAKILAYYNARRRITRDNNLLKLGERAGWKRPGYSY